MTARRRSCDGSRGVRTFSHVQPHLKVATIAGSKFRRGKTSSTQACIQNFFVHLESFTTNRFIDSVRLLLPVCIQQKFLLFVPSPKMFSIRALSRSVPRTISRSIVRPVRVTLPKTAFFQPAWNTTARSTAAFSTTRARWEPAGEGMFHEDEVFAGLRHVADVCLSSRR